MSYFFRFLGLVADLPRPTKRAIVLITDVVICLASVIVAYSLRMGVWVLWNPPIATTCVIALAVMMPVFLWLRVYTAIFRYAGRGTARALFRAGFVYTLIFGSLIGIGNFLGIPRTTGILQPMIFIGLVTNSRLLARFLLVDLLNRNQHEGEIRNVLIYGAGRAGKSVAHSITLEAGFHLVGYLEDDGRLDGQSLDGVKVFHSSKLKSVIEQFDVSDILLAMPGRSRAERRELVEWLTEHNLHVQTLPDVKDLLAGNVSINDFRDIEIEDLLGREPVVPNELLLSRTVLGKVVMVTGAGGSIGSELCRQIVEIGAKRLIMLEVSEFALYTLERELQRAISIRGAEVELYAALGSVLDETRVDEIFDLYRPDTVYHAAAYKHVPMVEANPVQGAHNNVLGTYHVAQSAQRHRTPNFILISTDKAVRPTNVMGATKRASELVVQALAPMSRETTFSMVRFGNVLGSSGSVVPVFRAQILEGGPLTLTHREVTRYFMTIPEAAQLVLQAAGLARGGEVFVLDMGEPVRIEDLARTMIVLSGRAVRDEQNPNGDIAIEEVGLRPGEKLYEELLIGDNPEPTSHPRIMKARETGLQWNDLEDLLMALRDCRDDTAVVDILAKIVPEFTRDSRPMSRHPSAMLHTHSGSRGRPKDG